MTAKDYLLYYSDYQRAERVITTLTTELITRLTLQQLKMLVMEKRTLTEKDRELIEEAYSTTYRSTFNRLIAEAETDMAREIIRSIMMDVEIED